MEKQLSTVPQFQVYVFNYPESAYKKLVYDMHVYVDIHVYLYTHMQASRFYFCVCVSLLMFKVLLVTYATMCLCVTY
jgi:hypothetical protein